MVGREERRFRGLFCAGNIAFRSIDFFSLRTDFGEIKIERTPPAAGHNTTTPPHRPTTPRTSTKPRVERSSSLDYVVMVFFIALLLVARRRDLKKRVLGGGRNRFSALGMNTRDKRARAR